jgi:hypothetical protein
MGCSLDHSYLSIGWKFYKQKVINRDPGLDNPIIDKKVFREEFSVRSEKNQNKIYYMITFIETTFVSNIH